MGDEYVCEEKRFFSFFFLSPVDVVVDVAEWEVGVKSKVGQGCACEWEETCCWMREGGDSGGSYVPMPQKMGEQQGYEYSSGTVAQAVVIWSSLKGFAHLRNRYREKKGGVCKPN